MVPRKTGLPLPLRRALLPHKSSRSE